MKTPKEIIDKYFPSGLHEDPEQSELNKIFIFNAMEEYASQFKSQSDNPTQMSNTKEWTTPNENDEIDVPDELMPLFNQIGTQIRLHTISGKNEVLTVAHCVRNAQKFFQSRISELEAENKRLREEIEAQQVEIVKKDEQLDNHRWIPVTETLPEVLHVRIKLSDGSEINALTQNDGDFYWELLHRFIPEYAVTHFIPQPPKEQ